MKKLSVFLCVLFLCFGCTNTTKKEMGAKIKNNSVIEIAAGAPECNMNLKKVNNTYDYTVANIDLINEYAGDIKNGDITTALKKAINRITSCRRSDGQVLGTTIFIKAGKYTLTDTIYLSNYMSIIGEVKSGIANGTVLKIVHKKGPAIQFIGDQSAIKNIAFWYPNQKVNENTKEFDTYPATIHQNGYIGITLENIFFVNSYIAMDFKTDKDNNSVQFLKNIYGTPLKAGLINDGNKDTIKIENLRFSSAYWEDSGLEIFEDKVKAKLRLLLSQKADGIIFENVDWYFLSNITIGGYHNGILLRSSTRGKAEGELYNANIYDCIYPIRMEAAKHTIITKATLASVGGGNALYIGNINATVSLNSCTLSAKNNGSAINTLGTGAISITNSTITGKINRANSNAKLSFSGSELSGTGFDEYGKWGGNTGPGDSDYSKQVVTKPSGSVIKTLVRVNEFQSLIDTISAQGGGILYVPAGIYVIRETITIKPGVEVRGATPWAHKNGGTVIKVAFRGTAFVLKERSGLNGLTIEYDEIKDPATSTLPKNYAVQGNGSNIYIMNLGIVNSWNGIDLKSKRCDNHYVRAIWASFLEHGISVGGGSQNGIIRDCHLTTNALAGYGLIHARNMKYTLEHGIPFSVENSKGEILFNNFTWGPDVGYDIKNGTSNVKLIGCGADRVNKGIRLSGTITNSEFVNMMLVTKNSSQVEINNNIETLNINAGNNHYIEFDASYRAGKVNIINSMSWGNQVATAYLLKGTGDTHINGGIIEESRSAIVQNRVQALSLFSLIFNQSSGSNYIEIENGKDSTSTSKNANFVCPICKDGTCNISNSANISFGHNKNCVR